MSRHIAACWDIRISRDECTYRRASLALRVDEACESANVDLAMVLMVEDQARSDDILQPGLQYGDVSLSPRHHGAYLPDLRPVDGLHSLVDELVAAVGEHPQCLGLTVLGQES